MLFKLLCSTSLVGLVSQSRLGFCIAFPQTAQRLSLTVFDDYVPFYIKLIILHWKEYFLFGHFDQSYICQWCDLCRKQSTKTFPIQLFVLYLYANNNKLLMSFNTKPLKTRSLLSTDTRMSIITHLTSRGEVCRLSLSRL